MNINEIDALFPLIVDDNFKKLYPLVLNIKDLYQNDPLTYKAIADRFAKKDQLDTVRLKFLRLFKGEFKDDIQKFYHFITAEFYLKVISQHKNRSVVLKLLNMLHQDHLPNLTQIISKIKANEYIFPSRLIFWLGELLIRLNLDSPPVPSEYVKITANYLNSMLRAIEKGYYSKDFPSFIEVVAIYFRLFDIILNIVFYRVDEWDDRCIDKYGGELEKYHDQSLDLVLNHEIKLQIHNNNLTIKNKNIFAHSMPVKKITEFNNLKLQFALQRDKIIRNEDFKASWLIDHLDKVLSKNNLKKWEQTLSNLNNYKNKKKRKNLPVSDDVAFVSDFNYLLEANYLGERKFKDFLINRKKQLFDFGGNKLSFHKKREDTWRIVTDLSKEEAENLWDTKPLGQYSGSKLKKAWSDLQYPLYDIPQMTYQFELNSTIVKDQSFMRHFLKQQQHELYDQIYPVKYEKIS